MSFIFGYLAGTQAAARMGAMARSNTSFAPAVSSESDKLSDRLDRMALVIEAMWSLLEENGYSPDDLAARIEEMDVADGVRDGRVQKPPVRCRACEAMMSADSPACQICGEPNTDPDVLANL